jgi:hypothetical protein
MASLQALEEEVEAYCRERAQALADRATGRVAWADVGAVEKAHPLVVAKETVFAVQSASESRGTPDGHRPRLLALLPFLRRAALEARARPFEDALARARLASTVRTAGAELPLAGAWTAVAEEPDSARRAALARAAAEAELSLWDAVQRRWEALHTAARGLGLPGPWTRSPLAAEAADFLRATEAAWRDVLGYALRKQDVGLRPLPHGEAGLEALLRLAHTPVPGAFPRREGLGVLRRWLAEAGLPLEASGRLRLGEASEAGQQEAACFPVEVPERVLLVVPHGGHGAFPQLLEAAGRARAAASVQASAGLRARRLGDASVRAAAGPLFRGVLLSTPWLRRFLRLGPTEAKEVARLAALAHLGELRMLAARLPVLQALEDGGPSLALLRTAAQAVGEALFLRVPLGAVLPAFGGWPLEAEALQAAALAECLKRSADERFDAEDFRNPEAARWLGTLWARGADVDASVLAEELGGSLSLRQVGQRLEAVLGA